MKLFPCLVPSVEGRVSGISRSLLRSEGFEEDRYLSKDALLISLQRHRFCDLRLEIGPRDATLSDDRQQRADLQLGMIGHGNRHRSVWGSPLHDDVAASPSNLRKPMTLKNPADLAAREDAKPTHAPLRMW